MLQENKKRKWNEGAAWPQMRECPYRVGWVSPSVHPGHTARKTPRGSNASTGGCKESKWQLFINKQTNKQTYKQTNNGNNASTGGCKQCKWQRLMTSIFGKNEQQEINDKHTLWFWFRHNMRYVNFTFLHWPWFWQRQLWALGSTQALASPPLCSMENTSEEKLCCLILDKTTSFVKSFHLRQLMIIVKVSVVHLNLHQSSMNRSTPISSADDQITSTW